MITMMEHGYLYRLRTQCQAFNLKNVKMDSDKVAIAYFKQMAPQPVEYTLTVDQVGTGTVAPYAAVTLTKFLSLKR
ncbi:hypothetical protein [Paenibacillus sp. FSL R7-277]|uniref:hypothetical protein n=1 Tax=Paenibacillus sp. FSL R7-277 TaxID=1227352 RepID=UPI0004BAE60C|nr:hypothetical protein [Paenibacillus sp. FSL R7-277]